MLAIEFPLNAVSILPPSPFALSLKYQTFWQLSLRKYQLEVFLGDATTLLNQSDGDLGIENVKSLNHWITEKRVIRKLKSDLEDLADVTWSSKWFNGKISRQ